MATDIALAFCEVCQKQFSGWIPFEEHNQSPAHKRAVENKRQINTLSESLMRNPSPSFDEVKLDEFMITEDKNLYFCKLCQVPCSGKIPALNHCLGKSHRKQKQRHEFSMSSAGQVLTGSSVKLGDSGASEIEDANTNSSTLPISSGHILNTATTSEATSDFSVFQTNSLTGHFFCTVCNLSVSGVIPAEQHLKGKAHIKKAKRKSAFNRLLNETGGSTTDLESQFSRLGISGSVYEGSKFSGEENLPNSEKVSQLQENPPSSSQNKLQDNVSVKCSDQTSATSIDGGTDVKGQGDEDDFEMDKVTGHWKCKVCQVTLTGEEPMRQHLAGKTHQKKKKAAGIDQGSNSWSSLISNDFRLLSGQMSQEIKGGVHKEMPDVVEESPCHSKPKPATEPSRKPETSLAGPQVSPYLVQQHAMKADGVRPYHPKPQVAKDVLAKENLELAKQLSSPPPHGAEMVSPYDHKGVRSNPPLSDFLQHQSNAGMRSDMGHFWSLQNSSTGFHGTSSPQADGDITKVSTASTMDPIGTLPHVAKSGGEGVTPRQQVKDPIKTYFSIEPSGKLLCKVCAISVSGSEPALQHLQGKSHIKRQKAYEFNQNHVAPYISSLATPQGHEGHEGHRHIPPGLGFDLHQERFPSPTTPQTNQQSMTLSSPGQQQLHLYQGGNMDARHQGNPYHNEQRHSQFQQQGGVMRGPHPDQYNAKPFSVGQFLYSRSQGVPYSSNSPPQLNHSETSAPGYQGPVSQSLDHLDNYSFSSSSSHHSSGQFSDDNPHSLRGVSLAENLHY